MATATKKTTPAAKKKAAPKKKKTTTTAAAKKKTTTTAAKKKAPAKKTTTAKKATAKKTTAKKTTAKKTTTAAAKKKTPAKVIALSKAACQPSQRASAAGKRLYTYGDPSAGRTLATTAKKEKAACKKSKGLAGTNAQNRTTLTKKRKSVAQLANQTRIKKINTLTRKLYDAPGNTKSWIDCTKKATKQLQAAGTI